MKQIKKVLLACSLLSTSIFAGENFIEISTGSVKITDNFSTEHKSNINQYSQGKEEDLNLNFINFYLSHVINEKNEIFIKADNYTLSLGNEYNSAYGKYEFEILNKIHAKEWQNPYELNINREKTSVKEYGAAIAYNFSLIQNLTSKFKLTLTRKTYKTDTSTKLLERKANILIYNLDNNYSSKLFDKNIVYLFNLSLLNNVTKEEESTFANLGLEIGASLNLTKNVNLSLLASSGKKIYLEEHPIFNKKIKSDLTGIKAVLKIEELFTLKNVYGKLTYMYNEEDSNHAFFDKKMKYTFASLGYKF